MEWAQKRKIISVLAFAGIVVLLAAYPVYILVKKEPTCFDKKQNGTEGGVDCGGGCALVCASEVKAPRVVWAKAFSLGGNNYDLGAYVENANTNAGLKNMRYTIRVFDSNGQVLAEKKGGAELAPSATVLLFETGVAFSGNPSRVEVAVDAEDITKWTKASVASSVVLIKNQSLVNTDTKPRFDAVLVNTDPIEDVENLTLGAIIYDTASNPVAVSRTYINLIQKSGEQNVFFTWPSRFTKYSQGEMCGTPTDATTQSSCPSEKFITEIVITPRAIFAE